MSNNLLQDALDSLPPEFANLRLYLIYIDSTLNDLIERVELLETKLEPIVVPESGNILVSVEEYERFKELMARMEITRKEYEEAMINILAAYRR